MLVNIARKALHIKPLLSVICSVQYHRKATYTQRYLTQLVHIFKKELRYAHQFVIIVFISISISIMIKFLSVYIS